MFGADKMNDLRVCVYVRVCAYIINVMVMGFR